MDNSNTLDLPPEEEAPQPQESEAPSQNQGAPSSDAPEEAAPEVSYAWLRYTGPPGTQLDDPVTGRTFKPNDPPQQVTTEEAARLRLAYPFDVKVTEER